MDSTTSAPQSYKTLADDSSLLTESASVGHTNELPVVVVQHIASKLALPDLLSFKQTCKQVYFCIGERMISEAKDKLYYKFDCLSQIPKEKHDKECEDLTSYFNGTLNNQAGNIKVFHNGETCIKSEELEVVKIDAIDSNDIFLLGTLSDGRKFTFINAMFRDQENGYKVLTSWQGYPSIYVGNSYNEIIQLIKDKRSDALPRHITRLFNHDRIYY